MFVLSEARRCGTARGAEPTIGKGSDRSGCPLHRLGAVVELDALVGASCGDPLLSSLAEPAGLARPADAEPAATGADPAHFEAFETQRPVRVPGEHRVRTQ